MQNCQHQCVIHDYYVTLSHLRSKEYTGVPTYAMHPWFIYHPKDISKETVRCLRSRLSLFVYIRNNACIIYVHENHIRNYPEP